MTMMELESAFDLRISKDLSELGFEAAQEFLHQAQEAIHARGKFFVALSGGRTPVAFYQALVQANQKAVQPIEWDKVFFFFSDERFVSHDSEQSNYKLANDNLFVSLPIPAANIFPVPTQSPNPFHAARDYEAVLVAALGGSGMRFDLICLGLGEDGHTASLFPGSEAVDIAISQAGETANVMANWVEKVHMHRITFMPQLINAAACVIFFVSGADKAAPLEAVLYGDYQPDVYPAQLIHPENGSLLVLATQDAVKK